MAQPESSSEVERSNRLIAVAIVLLLIGAAIGWTIVQGGIRALLSGYTRIKVVYGTTYNLTLGETEYRLLLYHQYSGGVLWLQVYAGNDGADIGPIEQGSTYGVQGLQIVASEVHSDYAILQVKLV